MVIIPRILSTHFLCHIIKTFTPVFICVSYFKWQIILKGIIHYASKGKMLQDNNYMHYFDTQIIRPILFQDNIIMSHKTERLICLHKYHPIYRFQITCMNVHSVKYNFLFETNQLNMLYLITWTFILRSSCIKRTETYQLNNA